MDRNLKSFLLQAIIAILCSCSCTSEHEISEQQPKNIILLIGDGMGSQAVYAAADHAGYSLNIYMCQIIGLQSTGSYDNTITDSGAAATAIACGVKTSNGSVGVDPDGIPLRSFLELAEEKGFSTGIISTSAVTHATPASFIAHNKDRYDYEGIAEDFLLTDIDIFIGGGRDHFEKRSDGINLLDSLRERGYSVDTSMALVLDSGSDRIAGLIAPLHLPFSSDGRGDMLSEATRKALTLLSRNEKGFFLMVEGSQIDWAAHSGNQKLLIEEVIDFDRAAGIALDFAKSEGETLVIITADHETGGISVAGRDSLTGRVILNFSTTGHTGNIVPVYAYGPSASIFSGFYDNASIFSRMCRSINIRIEGER